MTALAPGSTPDLTFQLAAQTLGVVVLAADGTVALLNAAAEALWGLPATDVVGRQPGQVLPAVLPPALLAALMPAGHSSPQLLPPQAHWLPYTQQWLRLHVAPPAAGLVWVYWEPVSAGYEAPAPWAGEEYQPLPHATTARKHAEATKWANEQRQLFLLQLSDALRPFTHAATISSLDVQATAARLLGEHLGVDRAYYVAVNYATQEFIVARDWHQPDAPSHAQRYPLASWAMPWLLNGHTWVCHDVDTDPTLPDEQRASYRDNAIRAAVVVPLIRQGQLAATLVANQNVPRAWQPAEVALVEEVAERTWAAVERARAEEALAYSEEKYRSLFTSLYEGYAVVEVLADETGTWHDFRFLETNPAFEHYTGMHQAIGRTASEILGYPALAWARRYGQVAETGQPARFEQYAAALGRTFDLSAFRLDGDGSRRLAVVFADSTVRKQAEQQLATFNTQLERQVRERTQELRESRDLLHAIAESQSTYISAFKAIRDEHGRIVDLEYVFVNSITEQLAGGRALVGRRYREVFPEVENTGFLASYRRVIETGVPEDREMAYDDGRLTGWFRSNATKLDDGVLVIGEDITARKQAEHERIHSLRLLEQAEAVAGMGSWDYQLLNQQFTWSAGMYQLFGLALGQAVEPRIYLQAVVGEDRPQAEQLVRQLTTGSGNIEETLRLRVGEHVKTVRIKAVVLYDEAGQPVRVLGVDLDISELHRLEADNLHLRLTKQQVLFEAVQAAQEVERKRIAEGLHNGIGQLLFATKLRLSQLRAPLQRITPALVAAHREADQLLGEAMRQTRRLSHELVPLALEEFGLEVAFRDICRDLGSPPLRFHCHVSWEEGLPALPQALQLALYRMAQELGQNILKHARGATEASLEMETIPGWVLLRADDNGMGFATLPVDNRGLGLRSIRDRVTLLGGQLETGTVLAGGASVRIRIPLPASPQA